MPSPSQPDRAAADEVVQVFTGESLEEAMATAVAALGPGLAVRRARKVRAGVRGLLGRDRYEVLAVPGAPGALAATGGAGSSGDAVGDALEALLDAADEQEQAAPVVREVEGTAAPSPVAAAVPTAAPPAAAPAPAGRRRSVLRPGTPARDAGRPAPALEVAAPVDVVDAAPPAPAAPPAAAAGRRADAAVPLASRSGHPDPAVADHPDLPRARGRRGRAAAARAEEAAVADRAADAAQVVPEELAAAELAGEIAAVARLAAVALPTAAAPAAVVRPVPDLPAPAAAAPHRAPVVHAPVEHAPAVRPAPARAAAALRRPPAAPARAGTGWSRSGLVALGVPEGVLDQLPSATPRDDLGWVVALTAAIEAAVPAPHEPDDAHPVVVSGHGLAGAVAVLEAGCRGAVPGTISHAGRTAPATATELALVLRHHLTEAGA